MKVLLLRPEIQYILCIDFNVNFFSPLTKRRKVKNFIDVKGVLENKKDRLPKRATNLSSSLSDQLFCTIFDEVLKSRFLLQFIAKFYLKELFTEKLLLETVTQWRQDVYWKIWLSYSMKLAVLCSYGTLITLKSLLVF